MANVLKKIPKGWELVPVGAVIKNTDKVCCLPYTKWERVYGAVGFCVQPGGDFVPFGNYIRRKKTVKKRARK